MSSRSSLPFHHAVRSTRSLPRHAASAPGGTSHQGANRSGNVPSVTKPAAAYRQRMDRQPAGIPFNAPETWHEPHGNLDSVCLGRYGNDCRIVLQPAGEGYLHPVNEQEVRDRIALLPHQYTQSLEVVQLSRMSRKRRAFPCYGMQWGPAVYLYPIENNYVETYSRPPKPAQQIEAKMYGAIWTPTSDGHWLLTWTPEALKDFYLNNVLIHEIGHLNDPRNTSYRERERFANWFAIEYGYRFSRGR